MCLCQAGLESLDSLLQRQLTTKITEVCGPSASRAVHRAFSVVQQSPSVMASLSPERATRGARPTSKTRHPTAPSVMTVNGHFANVGEKPTKEHFEHGIQVINEVQEFKYFIGHPTNGILLTMLCTPVLHSLATYPSRRSLKLASITTSYLSLGPNRRGNQRFSTTYSVPSLG